MAPTLKHCSRSQNQKNRQVWGLVTFSLYVSRTIYPKMAYNGCPKEKLQPVCRRWSEPKSTKNPKSYTYVFSILSLFSKILKFRVILNCPSLFSLPPASCQTGQKIQFAMITVSHILGWGAFRFFGQEIFAPPSNLENMYVEHKKKNHFSKIDPFLTLQPGFSGNTIFGHFLGHRIS